ncbi:MAG: hypothetical protein JHC26_10670 [Thermofilum sp.]|jgi:hypothetical protein|uniref:hypothetical protein n=1 Tax=Thermofilum sp. TaxID=1961369 RepID=UPI0025905B01|nr:hypothetical protein [Thermofilum sp.]MCI4409544.1 hypothetical protein [Thermofilum sp.]
MTEEYLEDFLWLNNQLQNGAILLKEGQSYPLPSPTPVNLEITGAYIDENGNYTIVVTCSTKPLTGLFGLISYSEEDWARNYTRREQGWDGGIIKSYKGVRVTILFRTSKGDVVDTFLKPPYATVKRTITLPAPFSYVEATASLVFDVDEDRIKQTQAEGIVLTVALLGTYFLPYSDELAPLAAKLMKLSPSSMDYWITVSQIANVLQKMGKVSLATTLATLASDQLSKIPTAKAQPVTTTPPQATQQPQTTPQETQKEEETTYTPQPHPPSPEELKKKYVPI